MNGRSHDLAQHLARWAAAYGPDLAIPAGQVAPRAAAPAPIAAAQLPVAAAQLPAAAAQLPAAAAQLPVAATPEPVVGSAPVAGVPVAGGTVAGGTVAGGTVAGGTVAGAPFAGAPVAPPTPAAATDDRVAALQELRAEVLPCTRCKLHQGRQHTVFGEGNPFARVMFVGEAPGAREDESGRPFVGPAGQLLDRILAGAMNLQRSEVFIANINKCRPPANRAPEPDEVAACLPYLRRQVELIRPEVIVCLGRTAAQNLLGSTESTRALRGGVHDYAGIPVVVTWHPAYLLREPSRKRETWDDIKKVNRLLGLPEVPGGG